jgi:regulator of RNase E activity RraA
MNVKEQETKLEWIEYLRSVDSPTLSNAIELLKIRPRRDGFTPVEIRCLFPELGRMCGYAVTAQVETVNETAPFELERFIELYRAIEASPKPAVVALQELGGYHNYAAHAGEVMSTIFTRLGAVGLVSDCCVRDLPEVRNLRFHYFARGSVVSHASFRIVRIAVPIQIHGLPIHPGDLMHGDENGLLSVPAGHEKELAAAVDQVRSRERRLMDWVGSDQFSLDGFHKFVIE